jgi:hypothetical protein
MKCLDKEVSLFSPLSSVPPTCPAEAQGAKEEAQGAKEGG